MFDGQYFYQTVHMNGLSTIEECIQRSDEELYRQKEKRHTERYE